MFHSVSTTVRRCQQEEESTAERRPITKAGWGSEQVGEEAAAEGEYGACTTRISDPPGSGSYGRAEDQQRGDEPGMGGPIASAGPMAGGPEISDPGVGGKAGDTGLAEPATSGPPEPASTWLRHPGGKGPGKPRSRRTPAPGPEDGDNGEGCPRQRGPTASATSGTSAGPDASQMGEEEEAGPCVDLEEDPLVAEEDRDAALAPEDKEFYTPTIASGGDMHAATEEMSKALGWLMRLAENPGWEGPPEEDPGMWLEKLTQGMPDPDQFRAGRLREHVGVLEAYFKEAGNATGAGKKVLRWMREGINWPRVAVQEPGQEAAPFHKKKLGIVRAMLAKAIPTGDKVEDYLQGGKPRRVCFPNHQSTVDYASFLEEELDGMLAKGVVKEWAAADPPVVVNGLRVVDEKFPKLRLCINPMYLNLFMRYKPVQYERLSEVADMAMEGDYAFTTDDKSGYWQCPLHVEMWKYLAFRVKGKTYCFTHLPFGLAPACYVYTFIKQEIYRPLRAAGLRMAFLIDDQISLQRGVARTRCQSGAMCKLLAALGWTLSLPKCQLEPSQLLRFLGLMVDLKDRSFRVPEDKKQQLQSLVAELTSAVVVSDRIIAKVAGKVMALSLALDLAPLLARGMMKAMQGRTRWDKLYPTPEALKEDMSLMVEMMGTSEGRRWSLRSESISVIRVVGDASETQLAAFTPNNE